MFFAAAPWVSTSGNQKSAAAVHFRLVGSLSIFAIETLLASRGAELPSWWGALQLSRREREIIAKPLKLLHEALLSGRSFLAPCAQKPQLLSALAAYRLPFVNSSWSLLADFCNLSPTSLVALRVDLRWCGS